MVKEYTNIFLQQKNILEKIRLSADFGIHLEWIIRNANVRHIFLLIKNSGHFYGRLKK